MSGSGIVSPILVEKGKTNASTQENERGRQDDGVSGQTGARRFAADLRTDGCADGRTDSPRGESLPGPAGKGGAPMSRGDGGIFQRGKNLVDRLLVQRSAI